jgi:hypothetical protein
MLAESIFANQVVGPMLSSFSQGIGRGSGSFISARVEQQQPDPPASLTEVDDMRRVDFACHPSEPLKVLDDWAGVVGCLICGAPGY